MLNGFHTKTGITEKTLLVVVGFYGSPLYLTFQNGRKNSTLLKYVDFPVQYDGNKSVRKCHFVI